MDQKMTGVASIVLGLLALPLLALLGWGWWTWGVLMTLLALGIHRWGKNKKEKSAP